jgi:hypothetical protein
MAREDLWVRLKGDTYGGNAYAKTVKEFVSHHNLKRSDIAEWWRE